MRIMTSTNLIAAMLCFLALVFNLILKPVIFYDDSEKHKTTEINQQTSFKYDKKTNNSLPVDPLNESVKMTTSRSLC